MYLARINTERSSKNKKTFNKDLSRPNIDSLIEDLANTEYVQVMKDYVNGIKNIDEKYKFMSQFDISLIKEILQSITDLNKKIESEIVHVKDYEKKLQDIKHNFIVHSDTFKQLCVNDLGMISTTVENILDFVRVWMHADNEDIKRIHCGGNSLYGKYVPHKKTSPMHLFKTINKFQYLNLKIKF